MNETHKCAAESQIPKPKILFAELIYCVDVVISYDCAGDRDTESGRF